MLEQGARAVNKETLMCAKRNHLQTNKEKAGSRDRSAFMSRLTRATLIHLQLCEERSRPLTFLQRWIPGHAVAKAVSLLRARTTFADASPAESISEFAGA